MDYYGALVFKYPDAQGVYMMLAHALWQWYDSDVVVTSMRDDLEVERQETRTLDFPTRFDSRLLWRNASSPASTVRFCDSMDLYRRMPGTAAVKW